MGLKHLNSTPAAPSRVVVLGGSGFIGRHLVAHLRQIDIETVSLSSARVDLCAPESVRFLRELVRADDRLVMLSAITPDRGKDVGTFTRNLRMAENVVAVLRESACAHFVYVSSDAVYDSEANPVSEASCCSPSSWHGLMHLSRERLLGEVLGSRIPLLILRPCAVYGAGDTHDSYGPNRFIRTAVAEEEIRLFGNGEEKRDHLFIQDICRLVGLCLLRCTNGTLNVATGTAVSFLELARAIAAMCEAPVEIQCSPRETPVTHRHFDVTERIKAFPSFRFTSLGEGLSQTVAKG